MLVVSGQWWNLYIAELTRESEQNKENHMGVLDFLYRESSLDSVGGNRCGIVGTSHVYAFPQWREWLSDFRDYCRTECAWGQARSALLLTELALTQCVFVPNFDYFLLFKVFYLITTSRIDESDSVQGNFFYTQYKSSLGRFLRICTCTIHQISLLFQCWHCNSEKMSDSYDFHLYYNFHSYLNMA